MTNHNRIRSVVLVAITLAGIGPVAHPAEPATAADAFRVVRTFHIGNSLTDTVDGWLAPLADSAGRKLEFHRFTIPGAPTDWLWNHPGSGFGDNEYTEAFARLAPIDHLFTQPFAGHNRAITNEADYSKRFFDLCRQHSPDVQPWLYVQWPGPQFKDNWTQGKGATTGLNLKPAETWHEGVANHTAYTEAVARLINETWEGKPVRIVPGGAALAKLKTEIDAGRVPGLSGFFAEVFADDIHLKPRGRYLIALVHYACIFRESPEGKVSALKTGLTDEQAAIFQRIAWEAVTDYPWTAISDNHAGVRTLEDSAGALAPTAPLHYSVSWIGNTFSGGDAGWVPQDVQDIYVTPDGTVYTTVGWEEHRGNIAAFKDGALVQQSAHWKRGGIDRLVGDTIAANSKHIFFATGKSGPGDHDGKIMGTNLARRDRADIASRKFEKRVEIGVRLHGVAASEDRVYAACADERVRVFDADLKPLGDWPAPAPGELALDEIGALWIIDTREHVVRRFGPDGKRLPQEIVFPVGIVPTDVAVTPGQRLLVADGGTNRQVRIYRHLDTTPELERRLGEPGGVFAGPTPGLFGEHRLIAPIGVGGDKDGNVFVACGPYANTHGGTAIIQSYAPDDRLNWRVLSTEWLDTVDVDQATEGTALYGSKYRYALDLSRPPGRQWSLVAITLHPDKYLDDPRLKSPALGGVWHRWIQGRRYLFFPDMNGGSLFVFRFDPQREGEIAVFCGQISTKELWVDQNGNGHKDADETAPNPSGETRGWYVEENGTIWQATRTQGIFEHPLTHVLPNGVPVFTAAARRSHPMPAPFTELRRIVYDRAADAMYLGGSTREARAEHWKPMGPNLVRYDQWQAERRGAAQQSRARQQAVRPVLPPELVWHEVLPHEKAKGGHESYEPFDFAVEGDFVFVVYAGRLPSRNWPTGTVIVLAKPDGRFVGHFAPSGTRTGAVPMDALQDMVHSLNVFRRANGEYLVLIEDDGYTKNVLYRWQP